LDTISFDIVRIRDMVSLDPSVTGGGIIGGGIFGGGIVFNTTGQKVACMSQSIDCDTVCHKKNMMCIGVGLSDYKKNKCVSVIHHIMGDCNLSENLASNDCRAKYCLTDAICCDGGTCTDEMKPCCKKGETIYDRYTLRSYTSSGGAQFSVGETACYCK